MRAMHDNRGVRSWWIVGCDYICPAYENALLPRRRWRAPLNLGLCCQQHALPRSASEPAPGSTSPSGTAAWDVLETAQLCPGHPATERRFKNYDGGEPIGQPRPDVADYVTEPPAWASKRDQILSRLSRIQLCVSSVAQLLRPCSRTLLSTFSATTTPSSTIME